MFEFLKSTDCLECNESGTFIVTFDCSDFYDLSFVKVSIWL